MVLDGKLVIVFLVRILVFESFCGTGSSFTIRKWQKALQDLCSSKIADGLCQVFAFRYALNIFSGLYQVCVAEAEVSSMKVVCEFWGAKRGVYRVKQEVWSEDSEVEVLAQKPRVSSPKSVQRVTFGLSE